MGVIVSIGMNMFMSIGMGVFVTGRVDVLMIMLKSMRMIVFMFVSMSLQVVFTVIVVVACLMVTNLHRIFLQDSVHSLHEMHRIGAIPPLFVWRVVQAGE